MDLKKGCHKLIGGAGFCRKYRGAKLKMAWFFIGKGLVLHKRKVLLLS